MITSKCRCTNAIALKDNLRCHDAAVHFDDHHRPPGIINKSSLCCKAEQTDALLWSDLVLGVGDPRCPAVPTRKPTIEKTQGRQGGQQRISGE